MRVNSIKAITASSDSADDPTDEVKINIDLLTGKTIWGSYSMVSGETRNVGRGRSFDKTTLIKVFDDDTWPNPDDFAGSTIIDPSMRGNFIRKVSGDKSEYELNFTISA